VAVEQYPRFGIENPEERQARAQLIYNEGVGFQLTQFGSSIYRYNEVKLSEDGAYN
jgi:hypothetical protein